MAKILGLINLLRMNEEVRGSNFKVHARKTFIKEWRKHRGLTQERLAGRVDMSTSSISQLENGKQGYTNETLAALAWALDCEPGDLLSHDPASPSYSLWRIISGMKAAKQSQALRLIHALEDDEAEVA